MVKQLPPEVVEKKIKMPFGGDRLLGAFLDDVQRPCHRSVAKYFLVKELKGETGICKTLYGYNRETGKITFISRTFAKPQPSKPIKKG